MTSPSFILSREAERLSSARDLRRRHAAGLLFRVAPGVYIDRVEWAHLTSDDRYRAQVRAAALRSGPRTQFSHDSAAAMLRLPTIGSWPSDVHEVRERAAGGASRVGIQRHRLGTDANGLLIDDVFITSLDRTLVDIACSTSFVRAVTMADDALSTPRDDDFRARQGIPAATKQSLLATLDDLQPYRGTSRADEVISFADGLSGSPIESFGRVQFHALGFPPPELQVQFFDDAGSIGFADFFWRELDLLVEIDGRAKYGAGRRFQKDLSPEQILWEEKTREDRLRRVVKSFARVTWSTLGDRRALASHLRPYGLVASPRASARG